MAGGNVFLESHLNEVGGNLLRLGFLLYPRCGSLLSLEIPIIRSSIFFQMFRASEWDKIGEPSRTCKSLSGMECSGQLRYQKNCGLGSGPQFILCGKTFASPLCAGKESLSRTLISIASLESFQGMGNAGRTSLFKVAKGMYL